MIGGKGIERNTFFIPILANQGLEPRILKLESQQLPIMGVTVDNENSTIPVLIYSGTSPNGTPYIIPPGKSRSIAINRTAAVFVSFQGTATQDGSIYISIAAQANELFGSSAVSVVNTVNVVPAYPPTIPTTPQTPILADTSQRLTVTAATMPNPLQINAGLPLGSGLKLYSLFFYLQGLTARQPFLQWRFQARNNVGGYRLIYGGSGDTLLVMPQPYIIMQPTQAVQGVYFSFLNTAAIIGTLDFFLAYSGYYSV